MSLYGTQLADYLGAVPCGLENKTGEKIKAHFAGMPTDTYLMWSAHHVVVIVNSQVHEFSQTRHGYVVTHIQNWHFGGNWWVRKTRQQF